MKATEKEITKDSSKKETISKSTKLVNGSATTPLKSARPQKSMVRVQSLKPKRMLISRSIKLRTNS